MNIRNVVERMKATVAVKVPAAEFLVSVQSTADRLGVVDSMAEMQLLDLQYIDDLVAPVSSLEQGQSVCLAAGQFAATHGAAFNVGVTNSAAMPIGTTHIDAEESGLLLASMSLPRVELYKYLGVFLDRALSFEPQLKYLVQRGHQAFREFVGVADSLNYRSYCKLQQFSPELSRQLFMVWSLQL